MFPHWRRALAWLAFLGPFFYLSYGLANWWANKQAHVPSIVFEWEHQIPFWDWTIYPYWSINVFYALSLFLAWSKHSANRHAARLITAQLIAVTCFVLWPLHFSFGEPAVDGAPAFLFEALRGFDRPYNQAPSLHIALAVILWDWYRRLLTGKKLALVVLHVWVFLICASVLTTYQHHFIDIPTGVLLGLICLWLWPLERRVSLLRAWRFTQDTQRRKLALYYTLGSAVVFALAFIFRDSGWSLWLCWPAVSLLIVSLNYLVFGARGFGMNKHSRMHWPVRWLLAPYLLGARLNVWLWTRRLPASVEVEPTLRLGRQPSFAEWQNAGQPHIVSLCAELPLFASAEQHRHKMICIPCLDLIQPSQRQVNRALNKIITLRQQGKSVWVCCALGFSRSAAVVTASLMQQHGISFDHAVERVKVVRPQLVLKRHHEH
jgi:protein-tyrosine phosphatase